MSKLSKCSELLPNFHRHHCLASLKIKLVKGHSEAKERFNIIFFKDWLCVQRVTCTHVLILLFFFCIPFTRGVTHLTQCCLKNFVPSAPVRPFPVFAGPTPPELTADTLMTYMVYTARLVSVVVFIMLFTLMNLSSISKSTG